MKPAAYAREDIVSVVTKRLRKYNAESAMLLVDMLERKQQSPQTLIGMSLYV